VGGVPFAPPRSLSPSKVTSFRDCALAFRFTVIEHLADLPTVATVRGTFVHHVLEQLFWKHPAGRRSPAAAAWELDRAWDDLQPDPDFAVLALGPEERALFRHETEVLVANYFRLEDPDEITSVGVELSLEARLGDMRLRGIIDRLDLLPDGSLEVIDYKTGRAPSETFEQSKLIGVQLYALLVQEVLGRPPVRVKLLHLQEPVAIVAEPTEQALRGQRLRAGAVWSAIERSCAKEDFRPRPSGLCDYCRFRDFCPAFGGDPAEAAPAFEATMDGAA
jgi:putative RecB family exonuclease